MLVERKLKFLPSIAHDRYGGLVRLPGGIASVTASPLMETEAVMFETLELELAPGEVGRLIQAGQASAVALH
jgi:hypothetical protein